MTFPNDEQGDETVEQRMRAHFANAATSNLDTELDALIAALDDETVEPEVSSRQELHERRLASFHREQAEALALYEQRTERTRKVNGRTWDLLAPGTEPQAGDEVEDEGVWRPRRVIADYQARYDRAVFARIEAQRQYDADPTEAARKRLEDARRQENEALNASDDETLQEWERIDAYRAGEGREDYNASRRQVRDEPNANLKSMTAQEKAAHKREQARVRKQRSRAKQVP